MKNLKLVLLAALIGSSSVAMAAYDGSRDSRMDSALENYHNSKMYHDSRNPNPGPAARTEESIKRGASKTGHAIKTGAQKTGHVVANGFRKTGDAMRRTGDKMKEKTGQ